MTKASAKTTKKNKRQKQSAIMVMNDLEIMVRLGWSKKEREKKRRILVNLAMSFPEPPKACHSDLLKDTLCYREFITLLHDKIGGRSFRLIESLAQDIYGIAKANTPKNTAVSVRVTKYPKIKGLSGGVCFHYGENIT